MTLIINGINFSEYVSPAEVFDYAEKVQGPNSGISMGGVDIYDTIKIRRFLEVKFGLMPESEYAKLVALANLDYATVQYKDAGTGELSAKTMSITLGKQQRVESLAQNVYYKNIVATFRER